MPGVGHYDDQSPQVMRRKPSYRMRLKTETMLERKLRKDRNPGPGAYDPFRTSITSIACSMGRKHDNEEVLSKRLSVVMRESL